MLCLFGCLGLSCLLCCVWRLAVRLPWLVLFVVLCAVLWVRENPLKIYLLNNLMPYKDIEQKVAYQKKYREEHREKRNEAKREKCLCACGGRYTRNNRIIHELTMTHKDWLLYELEDKCRKAEQENQQKSKG